MDSVRTPEHRARVREELERLIAGADPIGFRDRDVRQRARGTLAALDWLEGRRDTAPSTGREARPDDVIVTGTGRLSSSQSAYVAERGSAEDWAAGFRRPPTEDLLYHDAVCAALGWWCSLGGTLAIGDDPGPFPNDVRAARKTRPER